MAVRKLSSRHVRFTLAKTLVNILPGLRARMPYYSNVRPMLEAGCVETLCEAQDVSLDVEGAAFARTLPAGLPARVERSVALITLENATVLGATGAVTNEMRQELLIPRESRSGATNYASYHDFRPVLSSVVTKPNGIFFNMMGPHRGHRHYFHFMIDRLPQLYYLLNCFDIGREPITVITNSDLPQFQLDIYRFIQERHPNLQFTAVPPRERWRIRHLLNIDHHQAIKRTLADPKLLDWIRRLVFEGYGIAQSTTAACRIYVSRKDTPRRRITNEHELLPILAEYGFEVVAPGTRSFRDQVALFASAEAIAGPHGAGLTNMLFAPKSAKVLEMFPASRVTNTYFLLALSLGQTYRSLIGERGARKEWFDVDVAELDSKLGALLMD